MRKFTIVLVVGMFAIGVYATPPMSDFLVNTTINGLQYNASVGAQGTAGGGYVVAFNNQDRDAGTYVISAQRYDTNWNTVGAEIQISGVAEALPIGNQNRTVADMDANGDFIVSWTGFDGTNNNLKVRRFNANGTPKGAELIVWTGTGASGKNAWSDVELARDGSKYVLTHNDEVTTGAGYQVRNFATDALLASGQANTTLSVSHARSVIANDGSFVVAYGTYNSEANCQGPAYFQRFDNLNAKTGLEVTANAAGSSGSSGLIAMNESTGDFNITTISASDVYVDRFNADGTTKDAAAILVTTDLVQNMWPSVGMADDGSFAVAYNMVNVSHDMYLRRFSKYGGAVDAVGLQLNTTHTASGQAYCDIDMQTDGDMLVCWDSSENPGDGGAGAYGYYSAWACGQASFLYGDANLDGYVDFNDILVMLNTANWQQVPVVNGWGVGDLNNDNITDFNDILMCLNTANWHTGTPPTGVPEPATMSLLALGALALVRRRRR